MMNYALIHNVFVINFSIFSSKYQIFFKKINLKNSYIHLLYQRFYLGITIDSYGSILRKM